MTRALERKPMEKPLSVRNRITNERGAIDLASIMVGVVVLGILSGIVAATVFAVIPWVQDRTAKNQLSSIAVAQSGFRGLNDRYGNSNELAAEQFLEEGTNYCTVITPDGKGYEAYSLSGTKKIFQLSSSNMTPAPFAGSETWATLCGATSTPVPPPAAANPAPVDPALTRTALTYKCDVATTGVLPMNQNIKGKVTWSDGVTKDYNGEAVTVPRTLAAGVEYKVTLDGTYESMRSNPNSSSSLSPCLRSVDQWGANTGVKSAVAAFWTANMLTSVPTSIPTTITNFSAMFQDASTFNDPDIAYWDVSNATDMTQMFFNAGAFNQSLNSWNVGNVTSMSNMFAFAKSFNQPLNNWNTGNVTNMDSMFFIAPVFNQPVNSWNTGKVENMSRLFDSAFAFNQPLNDWNVENVTNMHSMFSTASAFNKPLDNWNTGKVNKMSNMFFSAVAFNQPLNSWNTSNVTDLSNMFHNAQTFNQPLNNWNTENVTNMNAMFYLARAFNGDISSWNTGKVTNMSYMFGSAHAFNKPVTNWNVANVTNMEGMFNSVQTFNHPLNSWNVANVTNMAHMFNSAWAFNQPLNSWNVEKVTTMDSMFKFAVGYKQNLSGWKTTSLTNGNSFTTQTATDMPNNWLPPKTSRG